MADCAARETLEVLPQIRCKSTEPSYTVPSLPPGNEDSDQVTSNSPTNRKKKHDGPEELDVQTPTKAGRRGRGNPRANQGAHKSTVTASLPTSAVMEFSTLATPEKQANGGEKQTSSSPSLDDPNAV
jgi:hypothetical protein